MYEIFKKVHEEDNLKINKYLLITNQFGNLSTKTANYNITNFSINNLHIIPNVFFYLKNMHFYKLTTFTTKFSPGVTAQDCFEILTRRMITMWSLPRLRTRQTSLSKSLKCLKCDVGLTVQHGIFVQMT